VGPFQNCVRQPRPPFPFEEISIFSNGGHLGNRTALTDTNLKGTHPGTIPARFGLIWFSGFRGEDLNVIFYQNMRICIIGINRLKEKFQTKTPNIKKGGMKFKKNLLL
jgi:hypothetical protein